MPQIAPVETAAYYPELLSQLRHDLKTPLNQIIGYGEMLLEDAESAGSGGTVSNLHQLLEAARICLEVQSRFLSRPAQEASAATLEEVCFHQADAVAQMADVLEQLRLEPGEIESADLDRLDRAVGDLKALAHDAPSRWVRAANGTPSNASDPAATQPKPASPVQVETRSAPKTSFGRILVVDDNEGNRDVLSKRLRRDGYTVTLASNGLEALEILERETFDLVLLDVMMPGLDGVAVLQRVRANVIWKDTAVIMISAVDDIASVARCIEMGAEDYLPKPFDPVLLRARIGTTLERKRLRDEERSRALQLESALREAELQKQASERMLRNILPEKVAAKLLECGTVEPMYFEDVTIGFTDFVGFTPSTELLAAEELVGFLHDYFTAFDRIAERYGVEKLKTIGDSYMFACGLPERQPAHPVDAVLAALEMAETVKNMARPDLLVNWKVRVGLHTGPVIAGVVGIHKFAFDIWGESVNFASRMESSSEPGRVNLSDRTYARVKDFIRCTPRGHIRTKDGRDVEMYFAEGAHEKLLDDRSVALPPAFARRYKIYFQREPRAFPQFLLHRP